jgi:hypothetical protein
MTWSGWKRLVAPGTEVLIYVVDTNDVEWLEEAGRSRH